VTGRRQLLGLGVMSAMTVVCRPAWSTPENLQAAILRFTGGVPVRDGRVRLDLSPLVENGNAVPVTVAVDSPMNGSDFVRRMALFTERNPQPEVAVFEFSPLSGRALVTTRMRLATSQTVVAMAQMGDGTVWQQRVDVVVTLAACVEGG
jgi:sulfur-oxidizing protein SoxY